MLFCSLFLSLHHSKQNTAHVGSQMDERWHETTGHDEAEAQGIKGAFTPDSQLLVHFPSAQQVWKLNGFCFFPPAGMVCIHTYLFAQVRISWWCAEVNFNSSALHSLAQ